MKNSLIVIAVFCAGCLAGAFYQIDADTHNWSLCILYALMLQVGIGIGSNKDLRRELRKLSPKMLLVPLATITGTLLFSAVASLLLSQWSVFDCMAVGSGFAYYSLSSVLITEYIGAELGTVALISNICREFMTLVAASLLVRRFGPLAPISCGGATTMDVTLPAIVHASGEKYTVLSMFHGFAVDFCVPFLVTFFCSL